MRAIPAPRLMLALCLPPSQGNSWNASTSVTPAMRRGRLRYDVHARFGRAPARIRQGR